MFQIPTTGIRSALLTVKGYGKAIRQLGSHVRVEKKKSDDVHAALERKIQKGIHAHATNSMVEQSSPGLHKNEVYVQLARQVIPVLREHLGQRGTTKASRRPIFTLKDSSFSVQIHLLADRSVVSVGGHGFIDKLD